MARMGLVDGLKFKRLCKRLGLPRPYVQGLLDFMWRVAYCKLDPIIGTPDDVELAAEWPGEKGVFFEAVKDDWLDETEVGLFAIHDLWDHVPPYVTKAYIRKYGTKPPKTNNPYIIEQSAESRKTADNGGMWSPLPSLVKPSLAKEEGEIPKFREAITTQLAHASELQRAVQRFNPPARETLLTLTDNPLAPWPHWKRIKALDEFARFDPEVVNVGVRIYHAEKHTGKSYKFLLAICDGGATEEVLKKRQDEAKAKRKATAQREQQAIRKREEQEADTPEERQKALDAIAALKTKWETSNA